MEIQMKERNQASRAEKNVSTRPENLRKGRLKREKKETTQTYFKWPHCDQSFSIQRHFTTHQKGLIEEVLIRRRTQ